MHWLAAKSATGTERARLTLRFVHAVNVALPLHVTIRQLDDVLADSALDTYLEGAVCLRRAVAAALADGKGWEQYIVRARRNFLFAGRTSAIGDTLKLAGVCSFICGDMAQAAASFTEAEEYQREHGQAVGATQARILRWGTARLPKLSRIAVRFI